MRWTDEELDTLQKNCELYNLIYVDKSVASLVDTIADDIIDLVTDLHLARKSAAVWKQAAKLYRKSNNEAMTIIDDMILGK